MHDSNEEHEATNALAVSKLEAEAEKHGAVGLDWKAIIDMILSLLNCGQESLAKSIDKYPRVFETRVTLAVRWAHPRANRAQVDAAKATIHAVVKKAKAEEQAAFVAAAG